MNSNHPNGANDRFKSHGEKPSSDGRHFSFHRNPSTRGSARKAAEKETKKTSASETTCCERGMLDAEAGIAALRDGGEVTDEEPYCVGEEPENQSVEEHKSVILHLVSQLKLGMDLTKVVLPTFILEPRSTLEMFADFFAHPDLFTRIPDGLTSEDRMLSVLEFYLTSFHVGRKGALAKKPYNPILGETFHCSWDVNNLTGPPRGDQSEVTGQADGHSEEERKVRFVSEQVSHHPPISGIYAECPSKGLSFNANIWTKSKFYGMSIGVVNAGEGVITLLQHDEEYVFTFPNAYCRSILTLPWVELGGKIHITCAKSGYNAAITFHTKPVYGGKLHRVTGDVKNTTTGKVFCKVNGEWNGKIEINFTSKQEEPRVLDTKELQLYRKRVSPLADQTEMESRRVWQNVTSGLQSKDINSATSAKHALEEKQRKEARERKESNVEWKTQLFHAHGDGWMFNNHIKLRTKRDNEASKPTE